MKNDLSYLNPEGFTVFTSKFHRNRGTCCKSACLHCPYGYTIKKLGIKFKSVEATEMDLVQNLLQGQNPSLDWQSFLPDNAKWVILKDLKVGILLKNHIVIKHLILKPEYMDQGISKELVESYLFC